MVKNDGYCIICEKNVSFSSENKWLRDFYLCSNCDSIPRERALMKVIQDYYPNWRELNIHESSPANRGTSLKLKNECSNYQSSQYYPNKKFGTLVSGHRNENLETQTFENEQFDLVITQDVIEHVFNRDKVFKEIARTLKPNGAHIFTVPLVNKNNKSECRATLNNNEIIYIKDAQYHGNPVDSKGSLVTFDWGYDISEYIFISSNMYSTIIKNIDRSLGIDGEYIEVIITHKK